MPTIPPPPDDRTAPSCTLTAGDLEVQLDATAGPRVTGLRWQGRELLARLTPPAVADVEGGPSTDLHGGHRLWVAPEVPDVTYAMDDGPGWVDATADDRASVGDRGTPLRRTIEVRLDGDAPAVDLRHTVHNDGDTALRVAPWALTVVPPRGTALLPVGTRARDPHGLQASGSVVTWPYTDLTDPRIGWHPHAIAIDAGRTDLGTNCKLGVDGFPGWLAHVDGPSVLLVVVRTPVADGDDLVDLGGAAQVYACARFAELEVLGPAVVLAPGESVTLDTSWVVLPGPGADAAVDVATLVAAAHEAATARRGTG